MKLLLLICLLGIIALSGHAQQDTSKQKEEYCILSATPRFLNLDKVNVEIDFGQESQLLRYSGEFIKDEQEKIKKFHSIVDALNYMARRGWIYVDSNAVVITNGGITYHYIMKRPVTASY